MRGEADALTGVCGCVTNGIIFRKAPETVRSRFCKNRSKGFGEIPPTSEKWLQAALLATTLSGHYVGVVIEGGVALSFMR